MAEGCITDPEKALRIMRMLTGEAKPVIPRLCPVHHEPVQWGIAGSGTRFGRQKLKAVFTGCCAEAVEREIRLVEELLKAEEAGEAKDAFELPKNDPGKIVH